jgi:hypothetical protein
MTGSERIFFEWEHRDERENRRYAVVGLAGCLRAGATAGRHRSTCTTTGSGFCASSCSGSGSASGSRFGSGSGSGADKGCGSCSSSS